MGIWTPAPAFSYFESNLTSITSTTTGTTVTASGTANTKGSWTQLIASTAQDCYLVEVHGCNSFVSATDTRMLLDIGIGAAAAEVVLIPDLLMGHIGSSAAFAPRCYLFPIFVIAGTRISARAACATASRTIGVTVKLYGGAKRPGDWFVGGQVIAYGITAASSSGVAVTPGVSGAEGSWTQIVASTSQDHAALVVGSQLDTSTVVTAKSFLLDIGVGAATEVEVASNYMLSSDTSERIWGPNPPNIIWQPVPSGTRLAARAMQHTTVAEPFQVALYGVS